MPIYLNRGCCKCAAGSCCPWDFLCLRLNGLQSNYRTGALAPVGDRSVILQPTTFFQRYDHFSSLTGAAMVNYDMWKAGLWKFGLWLDTLTLSCAGGSYALTARLKYVKVTYTTTTSLTYPETAVVTQGDSGVVTVAESSHTCAPAAVTFPQVTLTAGPYSVRFTPQVGAGLCGCFDAPCGGRAPDVCFRLSNVFSGWAGGSSSDVVRCGVTGTQPCLAECYPHKLTGGPGSTYRYFFPVVTPYPPHDEIPATGWLFTTLRVVTAPSCVTTAPWLLEDLMESDIDCASISVPSRHVHHEIKFPDGNCFPGANVWVTDFDLEVFEGACP